MSYTIGMEVQLNQYNFSLDTNGYLCYNIIVVDFNIIMKLRKLTICKEKSIEIST